MIYGVNKISAIGGVGYLASPYSKFVPREGCSDIYSSYDWASHDIEKIAGDMLISGMVVISPIASSHHIEKHLAKNPNVDQGYLKSHAFWMPIDERIYDRCEYAVIAMMDSWEVSTGMAIEFGQITASGKQVMFFDPLNSTLYNITETEKKYPEKFTAFLMLAAQNVKPDYLRSSLPDQIAKTHTTITMIAKSGEDDKGGGTPPAGVPA